MLQSSVESWNNGRIGPVGGRDGVRYLLQNSAEYWNSGSTRGWKAGTGFQTYGSIGVEVGWQPLAGSGCSMLATELRRILEQR